MLTLGEIQVQMTGLKDWSLEGGNIIKNFAFSTFKEAVDFVGKLGDISEKLNHAPDVLMMEGNVRVSLTTHSVQALTKIDFDFAREIDNLEFVKDIKDVKEEEKKDVREEQNDSESSVSESSF